MSYNFERVELTLTRTEASGKLSNCKGFFE